MGEIPEKNRFCEFYQGEPPWDIGRVQKVFIQLEEAGKIQGKVLDVGCGTGENALYLAEKGYQTWGVDFVPSAIEQARKKAEKRGLKVRFMVWDAMELPRLGETFQTVIDCGLFHCFSDEDRHRFIKGLETILEPGGTYHLMCFSIHEKSEEGPPRRIKKKEIIKSFQEGWNILSIEPAHFESRKHPQGTKAWLATLKKS